ncbi:thiamine-phosphate kinase [Serinibacter arcticus]|uniref:Thiamine-monophosphate kinase n=1 Tax=Serinibacter arcticus TaxID=1655435 RepID=A0A2U1ZR28_9MICO|nr:thiamine-phosphate kinase [Serinibacter arcticus]PWD49403.1 thiamine-phosphate kinase [Serinibacter arcticus]
MPETVADLSESELLARFVPRLSAGRQTLHGPGDDAAVVAVPSGSIVVTSDVLVEDRHFRRDWSTGVDVGWRAAAQNLADVAAMGARPTSIVVALVMPRDLAVAWVVELAEGLAAACAPHDVGIVGGDLSSGREISVAVAAFGELDGAAPVLRSGARPGDRVALAGTLGRSAAGLTALTAGGEVVVEGAEVAVATYRRPEPPLLAGPEAARAGATAMLDVSDGLLRDAGRIASASGVAIDLDPRLLAPDVEALAELAEELGADAASWVLTGGEDHGLLATFPAGHPLPPSFRRIGVVGAGCGVTVDGVAPDLVGWDHFGG